MRKYFYTWVKCYQRVFFVKKKLPWKVLNLSVISAILPRQMGCYLLYLKNKTELAYSTKNQITSGLKFFYNQALKRDDIKLELPSKTGQKKLPEVLSMKEVSRLIMADKELDEYREMFQLDDLEILFIFRSDLIRAKEASGRPQDKVDFEKLNEAEKLDTPDKK